MALLLILVAAAGCSRTGDVPGDRPNIVLIISDDHGFPDYGFMGSERAATPNLDRMASASLVFARGYATPICAPSLGMLLSGQYPHVNGITGNDLPGPIFDQDRSPLAARMLESPLLLPRALSDSGYLTLQTGKLWKDSR